MPIHPINWMNLLSAKQAAAGPPAILSDGNTVNWFDPAEDQFIKDGADLISQWTDKSGSNNHLLQAGADAMKPLWTSDGPLFNGAANWMQTGVMVETQPLFIYSVLKAISWANGDRIFDPRSTVGWLYQSGSSPNIISSFGTASAANTNLTVGNFHILRLLANGASSKLQVDATTATTWNCGPGAMNGLTLCRRGGVSASFGNIQFKEIIIRKIEDTSPNETAIYNYLKSKYSL